MGKMKQPTRIIVLMLLMLAFASLAHANRAPADFTSEAVTLDSSQVQNTLNRLEATETPTQETTVMADRNTLTITLKNGMVFYIPEPNLSNTEINSFQRLYPDEKERFYKIRSNVMQALATIFSSSKLKYGIGQFIKSSIKSSIKQLRDKTEPRTQNPFVDIANQNIDSDMPITQKRYLGIEEILVVIDEELWKNALDVANSNEFGLTIRLNAGASASVARHTFSRIFSIIGISMGYNVEDQSVVFDIFNNMRKVTKPTFISISGGANIDALSYMGTRINGNGSNQSIVFHKTTQIAQLPLPFSYGLGLSAGTVEQTVYQKSIKNILLTKVYPHFIMYSYMPETIFSDVWYSVKEFAKRVLFTSKIQKEQIPACVDIFSF